MVKVTITTTKDGIQTITEKEADVREDGSGSFDYIAVNIGCIFFGCIGSMFAIMILLAIFGKLS